MPGIYIHIPFCHQACTYCNFHFSTSTDKKGRFVQALLEEIRLTDFLSAEGEPVETVYFGGGTPSILSSAELNSIMDAIRKKFKISGTAEITLEANPDDINPVVLREWLDAGINRLSVGIQSFYDEELRWMNRTHNAADSLRCIDEIKAAGFSNFSADLIYGSPLQSTEILDYNISRLLASGVPHISCYALTTEPKTILQHRIDKNESPAPDPDVQASQFLHLMKRLSDAGYEHYEISNYSLPGMRSKHNSSYWQGIPYLGLGPSAHSYDGIRTRRWNIANNSLYIESLNRGMIPFEEEVLNDEQLLNEYVMTSLRTLEGIDVTEIRKRFGQEHADRLLTEAAGFERSGKLTVSHTRIILTNEGKLLADGIAADLFV